jgi:hypothetical protein
MSARPILGLVAGTVVFALAAGQASAATAQDVRCSGELSGVTIRNVTIPNGGTCTLRNSVVTGRVSAPVASYFQATNTRIAGDVVGTEAQTVFVDRRSAVRGSVRANHVAQVYLFSARVRKNVRVDRATDQIYICASTVERGSIKVTRSARDIMIGGPRSSGCGGNSVRRGDMTVQSNRTDVQLVISGNRFPKGNLIVAGNTGPSPKVVQGNSGGRRIACKANAGYFRASKNLRWKSGGCRPSKR